jgi:hypothetical protein
MIPKIIHYCWFGNNPIPENYKRYIESWKKYLPGYEIKEWNDSNYDVYKTLYTTQAYQFDKYAFVSDYCRFDVLNQYGGIYLDTDVELIKDLTPIIEQGPYVGCQHPDSLEIETGQGMASYPNSDVLKDILEKYSNLSFTNNQGLVDLTVGPVRWTQWFKDWGFVPGDSKIQEVRGFKIYPSEYFCPKDPRFDTINITENTYSIHHFNGSWKKNGTMLFI